MKYKFNNRKVQKIGYTYLVSLPLVWVEALKLERGDLLSLETTEEGNLLVKKNETA
jgi:antitoxin component of MazEF toxin-antitoxin module